MSGRRGFPRRWCIEAWFLTDRSDRSAVWHDLTEMLRGEGASSFLFGRWPIYPFNKNSTTHSPEVGDIYCRDKPGLKRSLVRLEKYEVPSLFEIRHEYLDIEVHSLNQAEQVFGEAKNGNDSELMRFHLLPRQNGEDGFELMIYHEGVSYWEFWAMVEAWFMTGKRADAVSKIRHHTKHIDEMGFRFLKARDLTKRKAP